jgi:hypothetical protein
MEHPEAEKQIKDMVINQWLNLKIACSWKRVESYGY